jgi:hypothetical protein
MKSRITQLTINGTVGIQQGTRVLFSDYATDGVMWTGDGDREIRHQINFARAFQSSPVLMLGISLWDADHGTNLRADLTAEKVTTQGFDLVFRTWADTRIARMRADWTAIGAMSDPEDWDID